MNLTIIFLTAFCLNVCANSLAQNVTFSGKNVPLESIFSSVEKQTGFLFLYSESLLKSSKPVSISAENLSLGKFLDEVFKSQPSLTYEVRGKSIFITRKIRDEASSDRQRNSPGIGEFVPFALLRAKILDQDGQPLVGASVTIKKSSTSAITDAEGYFSLNVNEGDILVVTYVGYQSKEIKVKAGMLSPDNTFIITLSKSNTQLDTAEVVVNTGYEQISPERFIGSAYIIDSAVLRRPVGKDLISRLDGTINGLFFNKAVGPAGTQIQLRGISTLNIDPDMNGLSSQNPLIILDDFPFTGDIKNINPNDISSITVLKDAVATSIWGARAGNGVLVIKTKAGNYNKAVSVSLNTNISLVDKPDLKYFPQMTSGEFIDVELGLFNKGFYDLYLQYPQFYSTSPVVDILEKRRNNEISDADANEMINMMKKWDVRDDASKYIYRQALNKQNFLQVSGGSSLIGYKMSFGADNNLTNIQGPGKNDRYTINSTIRVKPIKPLELYLGIDYNCAKDHADGLSYPIISGGRSGLYPYAQLIDSQGNHLAIPYSYRTSYLESLPTDKLLDWLYKPLDEINLTDNVISTKLFRLNFGMTTSITSWLSGSVRYQYTSQNSNGKDLHSVDSYLVRDLINNYTDPLSYKRNIPLGGILDMSNNELTTNNLRGQLNIKKNWHSVHDFSALLAGEISKSIKNLSSNRLYGFNGDTWSYSNNLDFANPIPLYFGGSSRIPNSESIGEMRNNLVSIIANASYTFDRRYGVYISGRRDGSNLFGIETNNKYKPLWSIGGRWNVSNEGFFRTGWISSLAVKATYGYAGNVNNSISALSTIRYSSTANIFGQPFANILTPPNPDLRWEEVSTFNIAIDFGIFNNRITGTAEWYKKKSNDVISNYPLDPTLGITGGYVRKNVANLKGNGVDLVIQSRNFSGEFKWTSTFNFSMARTTVSKYFEEIKSTPNSPIIREGDIYMGLYAYKWGGLDPQTGDPRGYIGKELSSDYQGIFLDDISNQIYIGSAFPLLFGNLMNTFSYKGFSLSGNMSFRGKYYFRKPTINYDGLYRGWLGHGDFGARWQRPGDEAKTNVPSMPYPSNSDRDKFYEFTEINYEKGDHLRLQDIRLSYYWDFTTEKRFPVKNIEFYAYFGNLNLMIWKASSSQYDPDYPTDIFPPTKSYSFGFNVNL